MNDIERKYRDEMNWLQAQLDGISAQISLVTERINNGAVLSYPEGFTDDELSTLHTALTGRTDKILDEMKALHKAFNTP